MQWRLSNHRAITQPTLATNRMPLLASRVFRRFSKCQAWWWSVVTSIVRKLEPSAIQQNFMLKNNWHIPRSMQHSTLRGWNNLSKQRMVSKLLDLIQTSRNLKVSYSLLSLQFQTIPSLVCSHQMWVIKQVKCTARGSSNGKKFRITNWMKSNLTAWKRQVKVKFITAAPLLWTLWLAKVLYPNLKHLLKRMLAGGTFRTKFWQVRPFRSLRS